MRVRRRWVRALLSAAPLLAVVAGIVYTWRVNAPAIVMAWYVLIAAAIVWGMAAVSRLEARVRHLELLVASMVTNPERTFALVGDEPA